jgi:hypothetical protein
MGIVIPGPSQLQVQWGCRRCGVDGLIARSTLPVTAEYTEAMIRPMLDGLRLVLVRKHQLFHACVASPEDFILRRYLPEHQHERMAGVV